MGVIEASDLEDRVRRLGEARIAVVGDIRRNGFEVASRLRALGLRLEVFGRASDLVELGGAATPWMRPYHLPGLLPWRWARAVRFLRELGGYDLIHARGGGVFLAGLARAPYVSQTVGSDLRDNLRGRSLRSRWYRRSMLASRELLVSQVDHLPMLPDDWPARAYVPLLVDDEDLVPTPLPERKELVVFHPTNHAWNLPRGAIKGNDLFLRAFASFVAGGHRARLLLLRRGPSWQASAALVAALGLEGCTRWLDHLDRPSLMREYAGADVVVDQFGGYGTPGLCSLEAMACGRPVICCTDTDLCTQVYGEAPPLVAAWTEAEILEGLVRLRDMPERCRLGEGAAAWVRRHHGWPAVGQAVLDAYRRALCA